MAADATQRHAGAPDLHEIAELGATVFAGRQGWYWVKRAQPWVLGKDDPIRGPFPTAQSAGADCKRELGASNRMVAAA